ncbi:MAG: rod shape-determining protein MreC [Candidatus Portnoybacteria bacterium RIFCSPLOWO2_12_FULL_39_9]|uniref:Cell shape-determining protein MreC n=1 Tax=Candidatus Portnoybacteria bacterium RIFCSPHIGHO2_12_FULL_38_9 TaxID=1801997 RepID=A0A1G2FE25_9BACT|nr:MAG: rod shape-determining protein MreC [Candidatus Portnoybacteria bacterium RBG_13_40_8]OGZ35656.1 MAG: rod shape-determining protein MreC [Candidatus Portnoybacteria bacterium RIFCSPHIGHO2_02_FULL_39_12]OGZ36309.1 MAG: rod shape-determining protein MreC [Candidatus Portnoybacteria bacterium RIFCSPHIGHO2_12_FULL_38_9]OGZ40773.1 MAG: rod shape-determining protein MreC [Candidatus Portnoybacteria bacterium RIFCSPLOWO2_12_FULL_39_9]
MKKLIRKPAVLTLFIIIGLIFLNNYGLLEKPKEIFFRLASSFQKTAYRSGLWLNDFIGLLKHQERLNEENIYFLEENQKLEGIIVELKEAERENKFLRQQLNLEEKEPSRLILAEVIGQNSVNFGQGLLINKGRKDGLEEGMAVIAVGNRLVGRITRVFDSSAQVFLITHPNSRINILIQETEVKGIVKGESDSGLIIDWLDQKEEIKTGQTVVTSGLDGFFQKGLLIGWVEEVIVNQSQVFKKAKVKSAADFKRIERVFVIDSRL